MIKTFTHNDALRHLYGETNPLEAAEFRHAAQEDPRLAADLKVLSDGALVLDSAMASLQYSLSEAQIQEILERAARL
jgi:hypothetical protein